MKCIAQKAKSCKNPVGRASRCRCRSKLPRDDQRSTRRGERRKWFTCGVLMANE